MTFLAPAFVALTRLSSVNGFIVREAIPEEEEALYRQYCALKVVPILKYYVFYIY
jgi:hypothetical protein